MEAELQSIDKSEHKDQYQNNLMGCKKKENFLQDSMYTLALLANSSFSSTV